ncbi:MAG: Hpt domain-containing protein [Neisseriaceae bacterium]|nr:Hpt domain-containing protein [Neisseriaceae bacterium]MBQ9724197.1 Hpt domain-containing protein [Neisseriaceae bacterium]MBR1819235.1 Hpt domain-containing protein [Neisseriaceae bacterium]
MAQFQLPKISFGKSGDKPSKPAKKERKRNSVRSNARYRGLVASITIFILLVAGVLGLNFYLSGEMAKNAVAINVSSSMRDSIQNITRDLFSLRLVKNEDPHAPHIEETLKRLEQNTKLFESNLHSFAYGGQIKSVDGATTEVEHLTGKELEVLSAAQREWSSYDQKLRSYLMSARDISVNTALLDAVTEEAQNANNTIYTAVNALTERITQRTINRMQMMKTIQIGGVAVLLSYWIIFIFFFARRLQVFDTESRDARRETQEILQTVKDGLFLVDKDLKIGSQYSAALENIIGQRGVGGKDLGLVLESLVSQKDVETTRGFIAQLFNQRIKPKLINDLNPLHRISVEVDDMNGFRQQRYLDFQFSRVYDGNDIARILVSVSDITAAVRLEERLAQEREQNDLQMETLTSVLNIEPDLVSSFLSSVRQCMDRINASLKEQSGHSQEAFKAKLRDIYREIHSIKGESSALRLNSFVVLATSFEDKIESMQRQPELTGNDFLPLAVMLDELIGAFKGIEQLAKRVGVIASSQKDGRNLPPTNTESGLMQRYFDQFAQDIARRNNKKVAVKCTGFDEIQLPQQAAAFIKEIVLQMLRNSIYHGIEDPIERQTLGKDETGQVLISLQANGADRILLTVEDDGHGLDANRIRQKAIEKGLYTEEEAELLNSKQLLGLIFASGFSTADKSGEDAGRGVGMGIVKDRIQSMGGRLKTESEKGKFTRFTANIPIA